MNDAETSTDTRDPEAPVALVAAEPLPILPVRAGEVVKFTPRLTTPRDPLPVYHLKVPSQATRAAYQRDLIARCGDYPDDAFLMWSMRRAIRDNFDEADAAAMYADLDQIQIALQSESVAVRAEAAQQSRRIELAVARRDPSYSDVVAARTYYRKMMPVVVLQHFLVGWDNGPVPFRRIRLTPDEVVSAIPEEEFNQISTKLLGYLGTIGALAKN